MPFLQPTTLQLGDASLGPGGVSQVKTLRSLPAQFDATGLVEQQFQAVSADGTKVSVGVGCVGVVHLDDFILMLFSVLVHV